jgi:hypothetical protein
MHLTLRDMPDYIDRSHPVTFKHERMVKNIKP